MKKSLIVLVLIVFVLGGCGKEDTITYSLYGSSFQDNDALTVGEMYQQLTHGRSFQGKVRGEIVEVCTQKGCWMTLELPDGRHMRVTFKDYSFFVPKDSHGRQVVLSGEATYSITDVATLKHYAEDAGKSKEEVAAIVEDEKSINFVAEGVLIKD